MSDPIWMQVRRALGYTPIVAGRVDGANPLFVERYLFQTIETTCPEMEHISMLTQFGASPIREGEGSQLRSLGFPTQSLLVPAKVATHWVYSGVADFAVFYFLDGGSHLMQSVSALARNQTAPLPFSDPLVGASALQLVNEVERGPGANAEFMEGLIAVMLEQMLRVLTTPSIGKTDPRHVHYARVQAVLIHVRNHLTGDLSIPVMAELAGLSQTHFRRVFQESVGMPLHRYILTARLDHARTLLSMSAMPLVRIAQQCGFSSQSHFTASFRKVYALTPSEFRVHLGSAGR